MRLLSGIAQTLAGIALAPALYWAHHHAPVGIGDHASGFVFGAADYLLFFFSWRGVLVMWLFVEGLLRVLNAFTGEPMGTLPVAIVRGVAGLVRRPPPPRRPDRVTLDGDLLTVASVEPYDWDRTTTVRYGGRDWRLRDSSHGGGVWPHVYVLEPAPVEHLPRRVVDYDG